MALETKTFEQMVDDVLNRIVSAGVGVTDISDGSVIRTIVEAIIAELDIQNYRSEYIYDAVNVDDSIGDELDRAISVLGVTRNPATKATGIVRFERSTPAQYDIPIPVGTEVGTSPLVDGSIITFTTTVGAVLAIGQSYVDVGVEASEAGVIHISPYQISVMSIPIMGIDTISNLASINGGSDAEDDDSLRARTKLALSEMGKATDNALQKAIMDISGVIQVAVLDQNRGPATSDIVVVTSTAPASDSIKQAVLDAIAQTKACGIDVQPIYPSVTAVDVDVTLVRDTQYNYDTIMDSAGGAIVAYFDALTVNGSLIIHQMIRKILESHAGILDVSTAMVNTDSGPTEILRPGTITIDGVVWSGNQ